LGCVGDVDDGDSPGRSAEETRIAALRALFRRAVAAGLMLANPAKALPKRRRARSRRRKLTNTELDEPIDAIRVTSNDPDLDLLLVRFHLESGARRQDALNVRLRLRDIDPQRTTHGGASPARGRKPESCDGV
jgi:hypothetical protein